MKIPYLKKCSLLLLIVAICICSAGLTNIYADSNKNFDKTKENEFHIGLIYNDRLTNDNKFSSKQIEDKFKIYKKDVRSDKTKINLTLRNMNEIIINETSHFEAEGTISIANIAHNFLGKGELIARKVNNGKIVLLGCLSGYLDGIQEDDNLVNLSVHFVPEDDKCFINASFGELIKASTIANLSFGEYSDEMSEAVLGEEEKRVGNKNKESINSISNESSLMTVAAPVQSSLRIQKLGDSRTTGIFTSLSFPNMAHKNDPIPFILKVNVNEEMLINYIHKNISTWLPTDSFSQRYISIDKVNSEIFQNNPGTYVLESTPEEGTHNCEFPVNQWAWLSLIDKYGISSWVDLGGFSFVDTATHVTYSPSDSLFGRNNIQYEFYDYWGLIDDLCVTCNNKIDAAKAKKGIEFNVAYSCYSDIPSKGKKITIGSRIDVRLSYGCSRTGFAYYTVGYYISDTHMTYVRDGVKIDVK